MDTYTIEKGTVRAANMWKRHTGGRVSGLCTVPDRLEWDMSITMPGCPVGTHMKLCGLVYLTPTFERVKLGGWHELLSLSHENSDRVMAMKTESGIKIRTYTYRDGHGPATEMKPNLHFEDLGTVKRGALFRLELVPNEVEFDVPNHHSVGTYRGKRVVSTWRLFSLDKTGGGTSVSLLGKADNVSRRPSRFGHYTFAYAGGYKQPTAPGDINITCELNTTQA